MVRSVQDFGAKGDGATDDTRALQVALDTGVGYLPAGTYQVSDSLQVTRDNMVLRGDGWNTQIVSPGWLQHDVLRVGVPGAPPGVSHRPDLWGILDATAVGGQAARWGWRTQGDSHIQIEASPLQGGGCVGHPYGDAWGSTSQVTVDVCLGGLFPPGSALLGLGVTEYRPSPWVLAVGSLAGEWYLDYRLSDTPRGWNTGRRRLKIPVPRTPVVRVSLQWDFVAGVLAVWVNRVLVARDQFPLGLRFVLNDYDPFMVGIQDVRRGGAIPADISLYGLRVGYACRYVVANIGDPQRRLDGMLLTDGSSYFGYEDSRRVANLGLTDHPGVGNRVTIEHGEAAPGGRATGSGVFGVVSPRDINVSGCSIRDLALQGGGWWGRALCLGEVYDCKVTNVKATGGYHGIGSYAMGASYYVDVDSCTLQGSDAAYYGFMQLIQGRAITVPASGRTAVRLVGCTGDWHGVRVLGAIGNQESAYRAHGYGYGGNHRVVHLLVDYEGMGFADAPIVVDAHPYVPSTSLVLRDILLGTVGTGVPLVVLHDVGREGPDYHKCFFDAENIQTWSNDYGSVVRVDGPLWRGRVRGVAPRNTGVSRVDGGPASVTVDGVL
jgi:hypothetical protein